MTLRDRELPDMLVIVATHADAVALSPLATVQEEVRATLVATGPDPMLVDEALDEMGTPAGRILLPDDGGTAMPPALEVAGLLPRFDDMVAQSDAAVVVVRGGTPAALAGAQVAVWRGAPLIALDGPAESRAESANRSMIAELSAWQSSQAGDVVFPAWLDLVVHQRMAQSTLGDPAGRVVGVPSGYPGCPVAPGLPA